MMDRAPTYDCPGCGRKTTDRLGRCSQCRRSVRVERLTLEQLIALQRTVRVELERRRAAAEKALKMEES